MHWLYSVSYMEAKFGSLEMRIKKWMTSIVTRFSEERLGTPFFDDKRNEEILDELKLEPVDEKLGSHQIDYKRWQEWSTTECQK